MDRNLSNLAGKMTDYLLESRSENTVKKYMYGFKRWKIFCNSHSLPDLPADPVHVALYITSLLDNNSSQNTVNSAVYSIKWAHKINGLADPTENSLVISLQESAKRLFGRPVNKKDPVDSSVMLKLFDI